MISVTAALQKVHQTQRQTIMALLRTLRGDQQAALDNAEAALDYLLESQDELDRALDRVQAYQDRLISLRAARRE